MKYIVAAALLVSTYALATDFAFRVAEGKSAAATAEGKAYETTLGPLIGEAMQACVPAGSKDPATIGKFRVVANVSANGELERVEFHPKTPVAQCFIERFQHVRLRNPPTVGASTSGYPIEITLSVVP